MDFVQRKRAQSSAGYKADEAKKAEVMRKAAGTLPTRSHAISDVELPTTSVTEPAEISEAGNLQLAKAQQRIQTLTDVIKKQLQPEIEALKKEKRELFSSAKHSSKPSISSIGEDPSLETGKPLNPLEKRLIQSEAILKKTIEDLKAQLDAERRAKLRLQRELDALVKDIDHGINRFQLVPQHETTVYQAQEAKAEAAEVQVRSLQEQLVDLAAQHQATLRTSLSSLEQSLNTVHAAELAKVAEAWNVERSKSKIPVMGEARKLSAMLEEMQRQNRFLLGIIEEQRTLIKSLGDLLEVASNQQERVKSQTTHLANHEIYELKKTLCDIIQSRKDSELRELLEKKNTELAAQLAVTFTQKTDRKMRETQRFYASEVSHLTQMLTNLHSDRL